MPASNFLCDAYRSHTYTVFLHYEITDIRPDVWSLMCLMTVCCSESSQHSECLTSLGWLVGQIDIFSYIKLLPHAFVFILIRIESRLISHSSLSTVESSC